MPGELVILLCSFSILIGISIILFFFSYFLGKEQNKLDMTAQDLLSKFVFSSSTDDYDDMIQYFKNQSQEEKVHFKVEE